MEKLEISKQSIYDAKKRLSGLIEALQAIGEEKTVEYGNPDVNLVIEAFKLNFGTTKTSKYDRWAAKRLAAKHKPGKIVKIIQALAQSADDKYCPRINSVSQLEEKWVSVALFLNNKSQELTIDI